jgi:GNAT superfamily N-acetyltransferase
MNAEANLFNFYQVDDAVSAAGLCVDSKYRGKGVATEILKSRASLLNAIGVKLTTSIFSTVGAQKAAASAGYDENFSMTYEDMERKFPKLDLKFVYGKCCKVLSLKV